MNGFKQTEIGLIPEDWEVVRLGEVGEIITGNTPSKRKREYWESGEIDFIKPPDLQNSYIKTFSEKISLKAKKVAHIVPEGSVLVSCIGIIGRVGYTLKPVAFNQQINAIVPNDKVNKLFLFYILQTQTEQMNKLRSFTTVPIVNKSKFSEIKIPLPPLEEQQKIAKVLDKIQQAIEIQDRIIEETKNLKKSLMQKLFTEGLYGEEQKETEIGLIPKSWEVVKLGEVAEITMGQSPPSSAYNTEGIGLPFLQGKAEFGEIYPNPIKYCTKLFKLAQEGDILISVRAPVGDVNIAQLRYAIGRGLAAIKPIKAERWFLFYFLIFAKKRIEREGTGSTFKAIRKSNLKTFKIPLPPIEEQKEIAHILSTVDRKIEIEQRKKEILKELFKTMLHKLMSGEIRLSDVEI